MMQEIKNKILKIFEEAVQNAISDNKNDDLTLSIMRAVLDTSFYLQEELFDNFGISTLKKDLVGDFEISKDEINLLIFEAEDEIDKKYKITETIEKEDKQKTSELPDLEDIFRKEFKAKTIKHFDELVQTYLSQNRSLGNRFEQNEVIRKTIAHGVKSMKELDTKTITGLLDLSKSEIHSLIDEAAKETMNKYFKS